MTRTQTLLALSGLTSMISLWVVGTADAVSTERFVLDDAEALAAGELIRTAVHSDGRVTLGVELRRLPMPDEVPLVYASATAPDGTVFLGTGNDGRIYRLRDEAIELHAETGQLMVSSLAVGSGGTLYAGTLPEGRIYRVAADGAVSEIARPDGVEHVWDLVWDARRNTLFAATGPDGKVFAIDPQGNASLYWESGASHVMSLALDADGTLYAGTSDDAIVVRLEGPGRAAVVHDFPGNEITALDVHDGVLAVGANEFPNPPNVTSAHSKQRSATAGRAPRPRAGKGRLFRVSADGRTERMWADDGAHVTCVQVLADGTLYAGLGAGGRIVRVNPDRSSATWIDIDERQVLDLSMDGDTPFFVTGDGAAVYRVGTERPRSALWQSKVLDGRFTSRFGQLSWHAEGQLSFQTRSGNTETPDATWSDWSSALEQPGPVRSPAARFLQVRARFDRDPNAALRSVTVFFLPQNQRAVLTDVRVEGRTKGATKRMRAERQDHVPDASSLYKLAWSVDNPDGDRLRYRLQYRQVDQTVWRDMLPDDRVLTNDEYSWQTEALADAFYVVRVVASDTLDNPASLALDDTRDSEPLRIDNHAPRLDGLRVARGRLTGRAIDALGPIARLEIAVDGGDWEPIFPIDDLFDTAEERFEHDLSSHGTGEHIVSVRATDASGNAASAETQFRL